MLRTLAWLLVLLLVPVAVWAQGGTIGLRSGEHPGFGRVVFDLPGGTTAAVEQSDGAIIVRFSPAETVTAGARPPRNVRSIALEAGLARLAIVPGAQMRRIQLGTRLVLDIVDPGKPAAAASAPAPLAPKVAPAARVPAPVRTAGAQAVKMVPPLDRHDGGPPMPAVPPTGPMVPAEVAAAAAVMPDPRSTTLQIAAAAGDGVPGDGAAPSGERTMLLPFDTNVAAAAFRRGGHAFVVFDQRRPVDMTAVREDPTFAAGMVQLLPSGTVVRFPIERQDEVSLNRVGTGWTIRVMTAREAGMAGRIEPLDVRMVDGVLRMLSDAAGGVVAMPDPETGASLLVGTLRQPGRGILVERRTPEYGLPPTWMGVLVEPISDQLALRATQTGFALAIGTAGQLSSMPASAMSSAAADARHFTRRYDFPGIATDQLLRRLQAAQAAASTAPPQGRTAGRMAVAEGMVALGLGAEAQALLNLIGIDDARAADDPGRIGLHAIAAILAGRPGEAEGIEDPRLQGSDEINLWRALRAASLREGAAEAAPVLAADLALLLSYPPALRDRMLPLVAETLALGGEVAAARALVAQLPEDQALGLARALVVQADAAATGGDMGPAIEALGRVAQGSDRLARARAATRAVELQLAARILNATQAADALDRLMYAWRGDEREVALRQRIASLRGQAGQWRPALALLRESEQIFPERKAALRPVLRQIFADAIAADAVKPLPALDLVALAEENADLIPEGEAGQIVASRIADRLAALDLPRRAVPVLQKLAAAAPAGLARAELGVRLAAMHQALGNHAEALDALTASAAPDLPMGLLEGRTLAFARSAAALGDIGSATAALRELGIASATALRADLLEAGRDWPGAVTALREMVGRSVPPDGTLNDTEARVVLRLASAAAQAGDTALLMALRERDAARFPPGKLAEMFGILTAGPVQGVADLPRAAQEAKLARNLPAALKTLTP